GERLIDFCQSFGPNILGHRDPEVQSAVEGRLNDAWSFGACEPYSLELAEWITKNLSGVVEKVRFVSSGPEAVMSALRVARAATGRAKTLKFDGCYHGHVDSMLVKAGSGLAGETASDSAGVPKALSDLTLICPLDDEKKLAEIFSAHGKEISAVIIEPLPANFGLLPQRREFLQKIVDLAKANGSLVIFDEVISGFRVSIGGMAEQLGIRPDLVTYGKVIGGSFPVGAYGGKATLMDQVAPMGPVYQAGTLSANPISVTAGLATLKKMQRVDGWRDLNQRTEKFCKSLNEAFQKSDLPLQISFHGSLFWIHPPSEQPIRSLSQIPQNQAQGFKNLFHACVKQGVYLAPSGYEVGFVSLAHTPEILEESREKICKAAKEAYGRS
ncbi:MAG: glutamate-1-semialdehyde 2,1-aminomutase, partial [Bdellovibrionales bacterium]|nr:glutamate-1-semialdehyde 2,1-aminomutase [Bdellovibrionales bacterium]